MKGGWAGELEGDFEPSSGENATKPARNSAKNANKRNANEAD